MLGFNGKYLIQYYSDFPEDIINKYKALNIPQYYWAKNNFLIWKIFSKISQKDQKIKTFISELESNLIENLERTTQNHNSISLKNWFNLTKDFSWSINHLEKLIGKKIKHNKWASFTILDIKQNFIYFNIMDWTGHWLVMKYENNNWIKIWEWQDSKINPCYEYKNKYNMPDDFLLFKACIK
jgi:hypothetical protein